MSPLRIIALLALVATFTTPSQSRSILEEAAAAQEEAPAAVPDVLPDELEDLRTFFNFGPFKKLPRPQCLLDKECTPSAPYCLLNTNNASLYKTCVECTVDNECSDGRLCSPESYECLPLKMINGPTDTTDPVTPGNDLEDVVGNQPPLMPPTDLIVEPSTNSPRKSTIRWKASNDNMSDYQLICVSGDGVVVGPQRFTGLTTGPDGFIGLSAGTLYTCQAQSIDKTGVSAPSAPSNEFYTACGSGTVISMRAAVVGGQLQMPKSACALRTTSGLVTQREPTNSQPMCENPISLPPSDSPQNFESGQSIYYFTIACPNCCVKVELDVGDCGSGFSAYATSAEGVLPITGVWALSDSLEGSSIARVTSIFSFQAPPYESEWGLVLNGNNNNGTTCQLGPINAIYA